MAEARAAEIKVVGKSGQISLGKRYAGKTLQLQYLEDGSLLLRAVAMVPESQLWTLEEPHRSKIARGLAWAGQTQPRESDPDAYRHTGFKWEAIQHVRTPNGATAYSFRLSEKVRAIGYRDGDFLRIICLHPDHDSAYRAK
jgi:hypothetical protein